MQEGPVTVPAEDAGPSSYVPSDPGDERMLDVINKNSGLAHFRDFRQLLIHHLKLSVLVEQKTCKPRMTIQMDETRSIGAGAVHFGEEMRLHVFTVAGVSYSLPEQIRHTLQRTMEREWSFRTHNAFMLEWGAELRKNIRTSNNY